VEHDTLKSLHRPVYAEFLFGATLYIVENRPRRSTLGQPPEVRHREYPLPARRSFRRECGPGKTCDFRDAGKLALNPAPPTLRNTRADRVTAGLGLASLLHRLKLPEASPSHRTRQHAGCLGAHLDPCHEVSSSLMGGARRQRDTELLSFFEVEAIGLVLVSGRRRVVASGPACPFEPSFPPPCRSRRARCQVRSS